MKYNLLISLVILLIFIAQIRNTSVVTATPSFPLNMAMFTQQSSICHNGGKFNQFTRTCDCPKRFTGYFCENILAEDIEISDTHKSSESSTKNTKKNGLHLTLLIMIPTITIIAIFVIILIVMYMIIKHREYAQTQQQHSINTSPNTFNNTEGLQTLEFPAHGGNEGDCVLDVNQQRDNDENSLTPSTVAPVFPPDSDSEQDCESEKMGQAQTQSQGNLPS